jgi:hypothetical protein
MAVEAESEMDMRQLEASLEQLEHAKKMEAGTMMVSGNP